MNPTAIAAAGTYVLIPTHSVRGSGPAATMARAEIPKNVTILLGSLTSPSSSPRESGAGRGGSTRRDLSGSFASPHAVVGIFIVNNSPETMAGRFYNRRFASRSSRDGCAAAWMSSLRRVLSVLARTCVRAAKSPARSPVRAAGVISVNTLFWKILVTRVKRVVRGLVSCACCGAKA